jgi:hypothetical protein
MRSRKSKKDRQCKDQKQKGSKGKRCCVGFFCICTLVGDTSIMRVRVGIPLPSLTPPHFLSLSKLSKYIIYTLGQYHSWWTISPRGYHSPSSQCFYHWVNATLGGLLVPEGIIHPVVRCFYHWVNSTLGGLLVPEGIILPVVNVSITGSIPLLVDY